MKDNSTKETKSLAAGFEQASFPNQWKILSFRDIISKAFSGGTPKASEPKFWNGHIPWSTTSPIGEKDISVTKAQRYISEEGLKNSSSKIIPNPSLPVICL